MSNAPALPAYQAQAKALLQDVKSWLESMGLDPDGAGALASQTDPAG